MNEIALIKMETILKDRDLAATEYYNDALYYMASVCLKIGQYPRAIKLYTELSTATQNDNRVWDFKRRVYAEPAELSARGLDIIARRTGVKGAAQ